MLRELHVDEPRASSTTSSLLLGRASPRSPARPAPARRCSSRRSTCCSAAGPTRRSCATARPRRASKAGSSTPTRRRARSCSPGSCPATAAAAAYVDGRLATVGELAELGARARRPARPARPPVVARAGRAAALLDRYAGAAALDARRRAPRARAEVRRLDAELAALGGDERARAREIDLLRFQIAEIERRRARRRRRGGRARGRGGAPRRRRCAPRGPRRRVRRARGAGRSTRVGAAVAALADRDPFAELVQPAARGRRPSSPTSSTSSGSPRGRRRRPGAPRRGARAAPAAPRAGPQVRRDARRGARRTATRRGRASPSSRATRPGPPRSSGASAAEADAERRRPRCCPTARRAAATPLADAVTAHLAELAMPAARDSRSSSSPAPLTDDGADDVTFLLAAEPGGAGPAAGPGRVRRRARPRDAGAPPRAHGGAADARVRRGRRGHRWRGRHRRRAAARRPGSAGTRCCA